MVANLFNWNHSNKDRYLLRTFFEGFVMQRSVSQTLASAVSAAFGSSMRPLKRLEGLRHRACQITLSGDSVGGVMFQKPRYLATTKRATLHIASRGAEYHGIFPKTRRTQRQTNPQNSLSPAYMWAF